MIEIVDEAKRKSILTSKLTELSPPQRDTLHTVIAHLAK